MKRLFLVVFSVSLLIPMLGMSYPTQAEGAPMHGRQPFLKPTPVYAFIENRGQLHPAVRFYARSGNQAVYLTDQGMVFDLVRVKETGAAGGESYRGEMERLVFSLSPVGMQGRPSLRGLRQIKTAFHFFKGSDPGKWITHVPAYEQVMWKGVYSGIDMLLSCTDRGVEYAFALQPGSDPGIIRMGYQGIDRLWVDSEGSLVLETPFGPLKETAPLTYEVTGRRRNGISARFWTEEAAGRGQPLVYGFELGRYAANAELLIDPTLIYSSFLGGGSNEYGWGVAVDSSGCAYVAGYTASTDFPTENGYQPDYGGGDWDAFVTKYSADGSSVVYSSYLGGTLNDEGHGLTVDSAGCAYVTGYTRSTDFPTTPGAYDTTHNGGPDVFVTKLSSDGSSLAYSTYLGGSDETVHGDNPLDVAVDTSGWAYVTGRTFSSDFPTTTGAYQTTKNNGTGTPDIFVAKFNSSGSALLYSTYLGGSATDYGYGIAVDGSGYGYVGGWTNSTDFPTQDPFQVANGGKADAVVFKLNPAGGGASDLIYSTYLGGDEDDAGLDASLDSSGNAYITGYTCSSTDFPTQSAYQSAFAGGVSDAFVTKMAADGQSLSYSTYLGGGDDAHATGIPESGFGIVVLGSNPYIVGYTNATDFPTAKAYQDENAGGYDLFLTKFAPGGGSLDYSTYIGGSNNDIGLRVAVDTSGYAFATGYVGDGFPQVNPAQSSGFGGGTYDAFILKYDGENAPAGNPALVPALFLLLLSSNP